jgi:hypothetical protein
MFSSGSTYEYRKILENHDVIALEISCESKLQDTLAQREKDQSTWPIIFDGNRGPIAQSWLINQWTTTFLIDRRGLIHARNLRGPDLAQAIKTAQQR